MEYYLGLNSEQNFNFDLFKNFTGVGMIRGENLCINKMQYFTKDDFCTYVSDYLVYVASSFPDGKVWYRTADLVPHQVNLLDGCDYFFNEAHYLIGTRGVRRNLKFVDTYIKELLSFIKAYNLCSNLGLLIPYVSSIEEVKKVKEILNALNYNGQLGVMIEIPSMIFMLDELNDLGISNFTIGINDLTTNILGAYRENDAYNNNSIAILKTLNYIVEKVHSFNKKVTIAGYLNHILLENAKKIGIDIINIHYNEIPLFFDNQDELFFTSHYKNIKDNYKNIKLQRMQK